MVASNSSLTGQASLIREIYRKGIYFTSDCATFSYAALCLADGLTQMGIPVYADTDCGNPLVSDVAFRACQDPRRREEAFCAVLNLQATYDDRFRYSLVGRPPVHDRTVALCMEDTVSDFVLCGVDAFFCAHENSFRQVGTNRLPIAFGISSAMLKKSFACIGSTKKDDVILKSFRPSLRQDVRACLDLALLPQLERRFTVKHQHAGCGKWADDYYRLLASSACSLAYGGLFLQDIAGNDYFFDRTRGLEYFSQVRQERETVVLRWDSWRFWESLAFGCATIHLDFHKYGLKLPVMPENWKQYIGIDLANIHADVERLHDERDRLPEIAEAGRRWALEHYSPVAVARRFTATLAEIYQER